eukprot:942831_1
MVVTENHEGAEAKEQDRHGLFDYHKEMADTEVFRDPTYVGLDYDCVDMLDEALEYAVKNCGFSFISFPLVKNNKTRDLIAHPDQEVPYTLYSEKLFNTSTWINQIAGKTSSWIDLDSSDEKLRINSEKALKQELLWASHLGAPAVILPRPSPKCANYARVVNSLVQGQSCSYLKLNVPVALADPKDSKKKGDTHNVLDDAANKSWQTWNRLRTLCDSDNKLCVALEFGDDLPSIDLCERWLGEPVQTIVIPTSAFMSNDDGMPVLSTQHKALLAKFVDLGVQVIIRGSCQNKKGMWIYQTYITDFALRLPELTKQKQMEKGFHDYLQSPLQPLQDNLQSQTYETFERCPVKYSQYEKAITGALTDAFTPDQTVVIMVVGAGRGPLVNCSLRAAAAAKRKVKIFAIEKNSSAVVILNMMKRAHWKERVTVVSTDMRVWEPTEKADILVSELLGSWGDNELSPECLDGAQRFLKDGGISIPQSYTSFVSPVSCQSLWANARRLDPKEIRKNLETPYVVKLHNAHRLTPTRALFKFVHPNPRASDGPKNNERYKSIQFVAPHDTTVHGFAGYFESVLYKDVIISINPSTFSDGMVSWFDIFIPLRNPVTVKKGEKIDAHFWRCVSPETNKVWYEWCLFSPTSTAIHNPNGRSYHVGL